MAWGLGVGYAVGEAPGTATHGKVSGDAELHGGCGHNDNGKSAC